MFLSLSTAYTYNLSQAAEPPPVPELDTWKADMLAFGDLQCQYFMRGSYTGALGQNSGYGNTYYDAARVFAQMRDYTGDAKWDQCSNSAAVSYRETQIDPNSGAAPYNNFSPGLRMHHQRTGDTKSKAAVHKLATAMFAADSTNQGGTNPPGYGKSFDLARELPTRC